MLAKVLTTATILTLISASICAAKNISAADQQKAIDSAIAELASQNEARCECALVNKPSEIKTDCESPNLNVKLKSLRNGFLNVPIEIRCDNMRIKTKWYKLSCRAEKLALVATRKIEQNELITPNSIEAKWIPIELARNAISKSEQAIGKKARHAIPNGSILCLQALENPKPVEKGDALLIVYKNGNLKVSSIAIAQKSGDLGSVIPVLNSESQKVFFARIISKGQAEPLINPGASDENN